MKQDFAHIFIQAKCQDRFAQKTLYEQFSPKMFAIAKSYVGTIYDAEEVLSQSFYKAFTKINDCKSAENFSAWLRRIVINEAITYLRKNKNILYLDTDLAQIEEISEEEEPDFPDFDIQEVLSEMPLGYRLVFNLYIFEEKKHSEIAEILNIGIGTSKSQLNKAKKWLKDYFKNIENEKFKN